MRRSAERADFHRLARALLAVALLPALGRSAGAQTYAVTTHTIAGGGGTSAGGGFTLTGTIGQSGAATMSGGSYTVTSGFWVTLALPFTDQPLTPGISIIRALHVTELRTRINALRTRFGLQQATWTDDPPTVGVTLVKAVQIQEMRQALDDAYSAAGATPPIFTDAVLQTTVTPVKAIHLTELRTAVLDLEAR